MMHKNNGTDASKVFDLSNEEKEVFEWKAKKRLELRNQYLREIHNPNTKYEGHIVSIYF